MIDHGFEAVGTIIIKQVQFAIHDMRKLTGAFAPPVTDPARNLAPIAFCQQLQSIRFTSSLSQLLEKRSRLQLTGIVIIRIRSQNVFIIEIKRQLDSWRHIGFDAQDGLP